MNRIIFFIFFIGILFTSCNDPNTVNNTNTVDNYLYEFPSEWIGRYELEEDCVTDNCPTAHYRIIVFIHNFDPKCKTTGIEFNYHLQEYETGTYTYQTYQSIKIDLTNKIIIGSLNGSHVIGSVFYDFDENGNFILFDWDNPFIWHMETYNMWFPEHYPLVFIKKD